MSDTDQTKKPEVKIPLGPIHACIAAAPNRHGTSKCGRSPEREFVFTDADYAMAHYDRAAGRIPDNALAACPACIAVRKREQTEEASANAK